MLDSLTSHKTEKNRNELARFRTNIAIIPGGLTKFLQLLDFRVNSLFKIELRLLQ